MNISAVNGVINLIKQLMDPGKSTVPPICEYSPKPKFIPEQEFTPLERSSPEREGVSSAALLELLEKINGDRSLDMHGMMILRHGRVILDVSFKDQSLSVWKQTYSACKSVTAIAVGFAVNEGLLSLDEKIIDIFKENTTAVSRLAMKDITVENLLTMTSTVVFAEAESIVCKNWIKAFMSSSCRGTAGETFSYNSLNTYMLAAAVVKRAGESLTDYLAPRLFEPLGIENIFWEKSPEGIEKGGWGLYICPEDFAKIGQCFLNGGKWKGEQIIPKSWVAEAAKAKAEAPESYGRFDYGYQIWCGRDTDTFLFNGMLGQNVLGFRDSDVLIVTNAGNNEIFQQSVYFDMVLDFFTREKLSDVPLPENPKASLLLAEYAAGLAMRTREPFPERDFALIDGAVFYAAAPAPSAGILPLVLQVIRNNYTKGFESISFEVKNKRLYVIFRETDAVHRFYVGFGKPYYFNMNFRGDVFRTAVSGEFRKNEDGIPVLKIRIAFMETPCTETIKIFFDGEEAWLVRQETPGEDFVRENLKAIKKSAGEIKLLGNAAYLVDDDYIAYKTEKSFYTKIKLVRGPVKSNSQIN